MIRQRMLSRMAAAGVTPVLMETHGGYGKLYAACYADIQRGIVFDKDADKTERLAMQRPTWAVYEADCETALLHGAGAHLTVTALDIDAYGSPFEAMIGYFSSNRTFADRLWMVVNDGLRQNARLGDAWSVAVLQPAVVKFGNQLDPVYLQACRYLVEMHAAKAGYRLEHFGGWYTGKLNQITHYLVEFVR